MPRKDGSIRGDQTVCYVKQVNKQSMTENDWDIDEWQWYKYITLFDKINGLNWNNAALNRPFMQDFVHALRV